MEDKKIIQIINMSKNIKAEYDNGDGTKFETPVVCLALVELNDGSRYVEPMSLIAGDGDIDFSGRHESNFIGLNFYE